MKQIEINNELLTEAQAAAYLGLKNPKTLAVWRCTKRYPLTYGYCSDRCSPDNQST